MHDVTLVTLPSEILIMIVKIIFQEICEKTANTQNLYHKKKIIYKIGLPYVTRKLYYELFNLINDTCLLFCTCGNPKAEIGLYAASSRAIELESCNKCYSDCPYRCYTCKTNYQAIKCEEHAISSERHCRFANLPFCLNCQTRLFNFTIQICSSCYSGSCFTQLQHCNYCESNWYKGLCDKCYTTEKCTQCNEHNIACPMCTQITNKKCTYCNNKI